MGSIHGLKAVRKIVLECMRNIHPIYNIKILMIKKELANDPSLKDQNWERFLPQFKKTNVPRKKPSQEQLQASKEKAKTKEFTPFPPAPTPRKIDLQLESGEYFLSEEEKRNRAHSEKKAKAEEKADRKKADRADLFKAPEEGVAASSSSAIAAAATDASSKKKKSKSASSSVTAADADAEMADASADKKASKKKKQREEDAPEASDAAAVSTPVTTKYDKKRKRGGEQAIVPESERRKESAAGRDVPLDVVALKEKFSRHTVSDITLASVHRFAVILYLLRVRCSDACCRVLAVRCVRDAEEGRSRGKRRVVLHSRR
jgi:hypothetical protein